MVTMFFSVRVKKLEELGFPICIYGHYEFRKTKLTIKFMKILIAS